MQGVQVKLCYPLTMHAIPERLRDASCGGTIQIDYLPFTFTLTTTATIDRYFILSYFITTSVQRSCLIL